LFKSLLPSDVVVPKANPQGQLGFLTDITMHVDLYFPHSGQRLQNIDAHKIKPIHPFNFIGVVVHKDWAGTVEEVCIPSIQI
jgi:hypothetical protein